MKYIKKWYQLNYMIFAFILSFLLSKEEIINNPLKINENSNPVISQTETKYYIFTSGKLTIINKETGIIESNSAFISYSRPYVSWTIQSNSLYIFSKNNSNNKYYKITSNNYEEIELPSISYPDSDSYLGCIKESKYESDTSSLIKGRKCDILENEIIIYGKANTKYIYFSFILKNKNYQINIDCNFEDKLICKMDMNSIYICALSCNGKVYIYISVLKASSVILSSDCYIESTYATIPIFTTHTEVKLLDTSQSIYKILCAKNINNLKIECIIIKYTVTESNILLPTPHIEHEAKITYDSNILLSIPIESSTNGDCYLNGFNSELLLCCGGANLIRCARIANNFDLINIFTIDIVGENTCLSISYSGLNYGIIFFMNSLNSEEKTYGYYIYIPECIDKNYTIIVFHSINEDKEGNEETINNYFTRKTNTKYYIEFTNIPEEYGNFTLNNELMNTNKILINENYSNIIDFISTNGKSINNFEILYTISIYETYSTQCKINLTILPCYVSCSRCSKDDSLSNLEEHNCIEDNCKEGYYTDPTKSTNCFMIEEKKSNWYFDNNEMKFGVCDESCVTCDGGTNKDCLSCYSPDERTEHSCLYNKECIDSCPEGTYKTLSSSGYYECIPCYINCKSCTDGGNSINMKCDSCEEKDIYYNNNCYKEYNSTIKSFYLPESSDISSCHELINYYIEENTYECVSSIPDYGYFISNSITGLFSPCHSDCKTCSKNYTEENSNCEICNNLDYNYFDGNCVEFCPDEYYSYENISSNNNKACKKCYERCLTCNDGEIYNLEHLSNMNCLTCKKEVDPNDSNNLIEKYIQVDENCFPIITYTNEKIIFNISEISSEENEKTCLDFGKSIKYGEYQCIIKPTNTFYVLNNGENTGVIDYCDESCETCNGGKNLINEDTNCIECSAGYYKTEDSNTNCILESLIPENYFKNESDNIYYLCHINCKKCNDTFNTETNNMNCDECIIDYYFLYGTKNCYNMDFIEDSQYYLSSDDNKFHKCYDTCEKCLMGGTDDNNQNCINCKNNYYKLNGTNNCYNEDILNNGYYLKDNLFFPCEENCLTCSDKKIIINGLESNNCLSCDKTNKGLYLVNELNNCEPLEFKENGYYLEEDLNCIEIFYKCYNTCRLCDKGIEFDINTNQDNHNCLSCAENYYKLKNDLNPKNCYGNEMISQGYILIRNFWQLCHENCDTCSEKPSYNDYGELIGQNCITCYGDLHFIYETSDCVDDSILENGYYFDDNDSKYHKCDIQCKSCDKYSTVNDPKCLSCNFDQGYFPADNKPSSNCYNSTTIDYEYMLIEIIEEEKIFKKWMICYSTCQNCFSSGNFTHQKCLSCIMGYYLLGETTNCVNESYAVSIGYYFNSTYNKFLKCDNACLMCFSIPKNGDTNCLKCNEEEGFYPIVGDSDSNCFHKNSIKEGYFLDKFEMPYKWNKCYEKCATCEYKGNEYEMGCLSCKTNFMSKNDNITINFTLSKGNCIEICPNNFFLSKTGDCIEFCPNGTYEYSPNSSCVDSCPNNYELNSEKTKCILKLISQTLSSTEFKDIISNDISSFVNSSAIINCSDFKALIISSEDLDPKEQIKNGISGIEFGNCIEVLKDEYRIQNGENLIVVEIESKEDKEKNKYLDKSKDRVDLGKDVEIAVYDYNGNMLNLGFCEEEITIIKYIGDLEDVDILNAKDLANQGIDVFDAQDPFFNDICHPFKNENDSDITLKDRRSDIFQNVSFCGDECVYDGIDYELMAANCICLAERIQIKNEKETSENNDINHKKGITLNDLATSFTGSLFEFNFIVIKCYNLVVEKQILRKNIGFFVLLSMNILQIIFLIIFSLKCLKPIRNYMLVLQPFDQNPVPPTPPKKTKNNKKDENDRIQKVENSDTNKNLRNKKNERDNNLVINNLNNDEKKNFDNKLKNNKKKNNLNASNSGSHNIKSSEIFFNLNNKNIRGKRNKSKDITKNILSLDNNKIYGTFDISSKKPKGIGKDNILKKSSTIFTNIISPKSKESSIKSKTNINKKIKDIKIIPKLKKIKFIKHENSISKSENEKIISEKNEEDESQEKNSNQIIIFNKKNQKNLQNKVKEGASKKQIIVTNLFIDNIYNNKDNDKNNSKIGKRNHNIKNVISKNFQRQSTSHKKSFHSLSKAYETRHNLGTKKTESKKHDNKNNKNKIKGNLNLRNKNLNYAYIDEELNVMKYEEAINNDKRSFLRIYWGYLLENHIILNTFCGYSYLDLRIIKISFLIYTNEISFFLNAFFYTDKYISDTYHNDGVLDFFSSLPKSIYSVIVSMIGGKLLKMLSSSKAQLMKILKGKKSKKVYLRLMDKELKILHTKLIIYFICLYIFSLFFLYYVTAFCAVYQKSQFYWFYGCLESLAMDIATPFAFSIIFSLCRFLALSKHLKFFYILAKILNLIL